MSLPVSKPLPEPEDVAAAMRLAGHAVTPERVAEAVPLVRALAKVADRLAALDLADTAP